MKSVRAYKGCFFIRWLWIVALLGLASCYRPTHFRPPEDEFRLPRKIDGASDINRVNIPKRWGNRARLVTMGQKYLIGIPANVLFYDQSPRLRWLSYALLNDIVLYLKQFRKIEIRVIAYSSHYLSHQRERALALARANAVGDYLWSQGVDSRFIFTEGFGSDKSIPGCGPRGDGWPDARIEIVFREAIV